jgi:hypothetical protein
MIKLTYNETLFLNAMRNNEYNDALEEGNIGGTWTFTAIENAGFKTKRTASGVIASLVKKGLVKCTQISSDSRAHGDEDTIWFTKEGEKLFDNADGEDCTWGGPKLLKIVKPRPKQSTIEEVKAEVKELNEGKKHTDGSTRKNTNLDYQVELHSKKTTRKDKIVTVVAFTGMWIGEFEVTKRTKTKLTVQTKRGLLEFDIKTGVQTNCKNPKFANKIK